MAEWFSIEVFDGPFPARTWAESYGDSMIQSAVSHGCTNWEWHYLSWGAVLELEMPGEQAFELLRSLAEIRAALEAVPDPLTGLLIYRGRGGSSGSQWPRRPRPRAGSGAEALPLPIEDLFSDLIGARPWEPRRLPEPIPTSLSR